MPRLAGSIRQAAGSVVRIERSNVAPVVGARVAVGLAVTLLVGRLSGHTVAGVTATIGALTAGMASHQGTYRSRAEITFLAGALMGAAAFIGGTVGHLLGPDIVVTAAIGFGAAMLVSLGSAGMVVGLQSVVGMCVFSQFTFPMSVAARNAGLVVVGALVQTLLVGLIWPLQRFPAERRAVAAAYDLLAGFCRRAPFDPLFMTDPAKFDDLERVIRDPQPFGGGEAAAHQVLAAQADRMRLEVVALARARRRLSAQGAEKATTALDDILARSADVMEILASAVREGRAVPDLGEARDIFDAALDMLSFSRGEPEDVWDRAAVAAAYDRAQALAGQLRAVGRLTAVAAGHDPAAVEAVVLLGAGTRPPRRGTAAAARAWVRETSGTLRANLSFSSQVFRHAIRLAATLAVAVAASHAVALEHRYWLPMTATLVLRPDFASTVTRGVARVVGTLVGAGLVTFVLAQTKPSQDWLIAVVIVLGFVATSIILANYAIFSALMASLVVTLLAFTGAPGSSTAWDRSLYTVFGAALALVAYLLWPTWTARTLPDSLADLARVEGRYIKDVLSAWADPPVADRPQLERIRHEARLGRSNTEAALARWRAEPEAEVGMEEGAVTSYMNAMRNCVQSILALHADLPREGPPCAEAATLGSGLRDAMDAVAARVRAPGSYRDLLPPLRRQQLALASSLGIGTAGAAGRDGDADNSAESWTASRLVLAGETDALVNSVDTLGHVVGLEPP